jgi:hypothetical protein
MSIQAVTHAWATGFKQTRISLLNNGALGHGLGLLVDEELARAVRLESSLAIQYLWGTTEYSVWRWRNVLGVERFNEGSARLRQDLNAQLADDLRGNQLPPEQVERRPRRSRPCWERYQTTSWRPGSDGHQVR